MRVLLSGLGLSLLFILSACGGGGGTSTVTTVATVTVSGIVTYTDYEISAAGINYTNALTKPIRGAVVELHNPRGTVVDSANTTETGGYSFSAPENTAISIVVKAALGSPTAPDTKVIDNTSSDALYALEKAITTGTSAVTENFNAGSGWDGSSYTGVRAAAPFAILDVIHEGRKFVLAADSTVVFPTLGVQWSAINKTSANINVALGDGPGTSYGEPNIWLNGAPNLDTDEYDSAVIAHEWGHYIQEKFSRSDSPGGDHTADDIAHPSLAFDEGFATAMGSMIMNDPTQINTMGANQAQGDILLANIESDSRSDTATADFSGNAIFLDGFYSENSMIEVVWDLFDSVAAGSIADDDNLALGFAPMFKVMRNGQKNTPAFTSIFSFVHYLKLEVPASTGAIDEILAAERMNLGVNADEYEDPDIFRLYTTLTKDATVSVDSDFDALQTSNFFGPATVENSGGNKLLNYRYFRGTVATAGCYSFTATPTGASAATTDLTFGLLGGIANDQAAGVPEVISASFDNNESFSISVGALSDNAFFSIGYALASDSTLCD